VTFRPSRVRLTLAGQLLLLQLLIVVAVLVVVGAIGVVQANQAFKRVEGREAQAAAQTLAAQPLIRANLADPAEPGTDTALAAESEKNRSLSAASLVAVARRDGVVVVASDPSLIGRAMPTGDEAVLAGGSWRGTLDINGRRMTVAQEPVYAPESGDVVGSVTIGRDVPSAFEIVQDSIPNLVAYVGVASALGIAGSFLLSRRIKRQTLGLEPSEITGLVEHREAMLHGIKEGVIALDPSTRIGMVNDSALSLLGLPLDCVGRRLEDVGIDEQVADVLTHDQPGPDRLVLVGDRVLAFNRMPMHLRGQVIGSVTTMRDRTELSSLEKELGATRATTDTLRAQTHEFANQLHTISGLLQLEEYAEVRRYVDGVREHRTKLYDEVTSRVDDATIAALLIAKASLASERDVSLEIDPESKLGHVDDAMSRDLTTVIGNLVDNAFDAVGITDGAHVSVRLEDDDQQVRVTVEDSGPGVSDDDRELVFMQGYSTKADSANDGRGFGLALSRLVCRRRGGDVVVHNAAGAHGGATFTATLPKARPVECPADDREGAAR